MKKLSTVLLLALVALTACAWTAKGTGTQPAESEPTEPPAVAAGSRRRGRTAARPGTRTERTGMAVSFGMTRQAAQEAAHSAPEAQDDIFHELTRNGLSVAVCPLPALNQVNITITDRKTVSMTRNVAPAGGIVAELLDMKDTLKEVTP